MCKVPIDLILNKQLKLNNNQTEPVPQHSQQFKFELSNQKPTTP